MTIRRSSDETESAPTQGAERRGIEGRAKHRPPFGFFAAAQGKVFNVARTGLEKLNPSRRSQLTDQVMTPRKVG